jgi:hypothetical protein
MSFVIVTVNGKVKSFRGPCAKREAADYLNSLCEECDRAEDCGECKDAPRIEERPAKRAKK